MSRASDQAAGQYAPIREPERLSSLDLVRGVAVLGILVINIQAFAMPAAALANPSVYGNLSGADFLVWAGSHLFAEQKFLTLFSLLFGAGVLLSAGRAETARVDAASLHRRRMFWLMLLGIAHAYLLWYGDILFLYGVAGFAAYPFHRHSPLALLRTGLVVLCIPSLFTVAMGFSLPYWDAAALKAFLADWRPDDAAIAIELEAYAGGLLDQLRQRAPQAFYLQTVVAAVWGLWRVLGLMLIGMALTKLGVFAARELGFCRRLITIGLPVSLALIAYGIWRNTQAGWSADYSPFFGSQYNYWGSMIVALAYLCLIISLDARKRAGRLRGVVSAVGRTALSNYPLQSVLCTLLFYGHGLGWYGQVSRTDQLLTVAVVWSVQLCVSSWWLARFRHGPAEWLWRSLTYGKLQPLRRNPT